MPARKILFALPVLLLLCTVSAQAQITPEKYPPLSDLPIVSPEFFRVTGESNRLCHLGDDQAKQQQWKKAKNFYQQAVACYRDNQEAWYGLIKCYAQEGNRAKMLECYRMTIYAPLSAKEWSSDYPYHEGRVDKLMEFALLLSDCGQAEEAITVYNYAVNRLNYRDNKPYLKVLLPEFGLNAGQITYRPQLFQALAQTAIGLTINWGEPGMEHLREAVRLSPGSGIVRFHFAEMLGRTGGKLEEIKAEYEKARTLDPKATSKAAAEALAFFAM